jgi:hypothetical protein
VRTNMNFEHGAESAQRAPVEYGGYSLFLPAAWRATLAGQSRFRKKSMLWSRASY